MFQEIIYTVEGPVATITLNRPAQLNAWTNLMAEEVRQAFQQAEQDQQVVGIILTGADRAFCAGWDAGRRGDVWSSGGRCQRRQLPGWRATGAHEHSNSRECKPRTRFDRRHGYRR